MNLLIFASLPMSTAAQEIVMAFACANALRLRNLRAAPWLPAAGALAVVWVLSALASGNAREGLGHAWQLAPLVAVAAHRGGEMVERIGLLAASFAAIWAGCQWAAGGIGHAAFPQHLTLAYALLPPLGVAAARGRWATVCILLTGIAATRSDGAILATLATLAVARFGRPTLILGGAALATVALLPLLANADELRQRSVLWTGGLSLLDARGVGAGAYGAASAGAYDNLSPGFYFPNHAHDAAIQLLAVLGPAGLVAAAAFVAVVFRTAASAASAGLVGILVGGLTQDTWGDLEVIRAALAWLALIGSRARNSGASDLGTLRPAEGPIC